MSLHRVELIEPPSNTCFKRRTGFSNTGPSRIVFPIVPSLCATKHYIKGGKVTQKQYPIDIGSCVHVIFSEYFHQFYFSFATSYNVIRYSLSGRVSQAAYMKATVIPRYSTGEPQITNIECSFKRICKLNLLLLLIRYVVKLVNLLNCP